MNPFQSVLTAKTAAGRKLLVPYLTAGLPSEDACVDLACAFAGSADAIEVGIPFSDPIMDGPVIQQASTAALQAGVTVADAMRMVSKITARSGLPVAVMTYFNPIHRMGVQAFVELARSSGVGALIVPDLPFEEAAELSAALTEAGIDHVQMVAPTTTQERAGMLAEGSTGFVYAVSRLGVTGAQRSLADDARGVVDRVRAHASAPVLVGIGISDPAQAVEATRFADGVIVGSAVVRLVMEGRADDALALIDRIRQSLDGAGAS